MQLAANTVVAGRFRLNQLIGRGGMGSVWQATHLGLDIPCAVKFLDGEMSQANEARPSSAARTWSRSLITAFATERRTSRWSFSKAKTSASA
jgi:serine/threonine protein kinase